MTCYESNGLKRFTFDPQRATVKTKKKKTKTKKKKKNKKNKKNKKKKKKKKQKKKKKNKKNKKKKTRKTKSKNLMLVVEKEEDSNVDLYGINYSFVG